MKLLLPVLYSAALFGSDLAQVKAEPNLERRSRAALDYADEALKGARQTYLEGTHTGVAPGLEQVALAVELAHGSLRETNKNASKSPKHFKHAEIRTRELLKKLDAFAMEMDAADRHLVEPAKHSLVKIHEELLAAIMGQKKK